MYATQKPQLKRLKGLILGAFIEVYLSEQLNVKTQFSRVRIFHPAVDMADARFYE